MSSQAEVGVLQHDVLEQRPALRGVLHLCAAVAAALGAVWLLLIADSASAYVGGAVFGAQPGPPLRDQRELPSHRVAADSPKDPQATGPRDDLRAHRWHLHAVLPGGEPGLGDPLAVGGVGPRGRGRAPEDR